MKVQREKFKLKKLKKTETGMFVEFRETVVLPNGVESTCNSGKTYKDDPQVELVEALQAFDEIVMYDEGYKEGTEIKITGVTVFPEIECAIITHLKTSISGKGAKNSGRIGLESETFQKAQKLFDLIDILENEAYEYVFAGKRAQLGLFDEEEETVAERFPDDLPKEPVKAKKRKAMEVA